MSVILVEESKCRKCYACIRSCPVKAIKVEDGVTRAVDGLCVACGECIEACAQRARRSQPDGGAEGLLDALLAEGRAIALLDPSFPAAFPGVSAGQVVAGVAALGFSEVRDTSPAIRRVVEAYRAALQTLSACPSSGPGPSYYGPGRNELAPARPVAVKRPAISSACPAVVRLVERHYPDLVDNLVPVASPPIVAARVIREALQAVDDDALLGSRISGRGKGRRASEPPAALPAPGGPAAARRAGKPSGKPGAAARSDAGVRIVYVGPCVARKAEVSELGAASGIDAVLTFDELAAAFEARDIVLRDLGPRALDGPIAPYERHVAFAGGLSWLMGMSKGLSDEELVIAAGGSRCVEVMGDLARGVLSPLFVDASMCRGCLDAPALRRRSSVSVRKHACQAFALEEAASPGEPGDAPVGGGACGGGEVKADVLGRTFKACGVKLPIPSESEIAEILAFSGKISPQDHLDCGMCGYPTCRAYAVAVYQNMARSDMCVQHVVDRLRDKVENMKAELVSVRTSSFDDIYGASHQIRVAKDLAERAARSGSTVLLLGESGVGKEVFARAIHSASSRRGGPFVSVNCAAIPDNLMEAELFGYVEGAFTGAVKGGKPGKFELAAGGTIFLDEIGDMSVQLQAKLLRVLQTHKIERVGGTREIEVDVRVMAATNKDLEAMVRDGAFRLDLYYRLNVVTIRIPPLRERIEDIPLIISMSLAKLSARCPTKVTSVSPEALRILLDYSWPGNVRELENVLERALNLADGEVIGVEHLPSHVVDSAKGPGRAVAGWGHGGHGAGEALNDVVARAERETLIEVLKATGNNRSRAARQLGISRSALYEKLRKYGIV